MKIAFSNVISFFRLETQQTGDKNPLDNHKVLETRDTLESITHSSQTNCLWRVLNTLWDFLWECISWFLPSKTSQTKEPEQRKLTDETLISEDYEGEEIDLQSAEQILVQPTADDEQFDDSNSLKSQDHPKETASEQLPINEALNHSSSTEGSSESIEYDPIERAKEDQRIGHEMIAELFPNKEKLKYFQIVSCHALKLPTDIKLKKEDKEGRKFVRNFVKSTKKVDKLKLALSFLNIKESEALGLLAFRLLLPPTNN